MVKRKTKSLPLKWKEDRSATDQKPSPEGKGERGATNPKPSPEGKGDRLRWMRGASGQFMLP